jgi:hypothetical protein
LGQILLTNHSGLTQVSPVDLRVLLSTFQRVTADDLLAIFGQDPSGKPVRLTLCFENSAMKEQMEHLILSLLTK